MSKTEKKEWNGTWIPKELWLTKELTWMEKLVYLEIDGLDNENGCYASNNYLAKTFDLSPSRISEIISSLVLKQFLTAEYVYENNSTKRILRAAEIKRFNRKDSDKYPKPKVLRKMSKDKLKIEIDAVRNRAKLRIDEQ